MVSDQSICATAVAVFHPSVTCWCRLASGCLVCMANVLLLVGLYGTDTVTDLRQ